MKQPPSTDATPPKVTQTEREIWNDLQIARFLAVADQSKYGPIWWVALTTGMRRGELLGLRWYDVDFDRRILRIVQTVGRHGTGYLIQPPKTKSSRRTLAVPSGLMALLREHKARQNEQLLQLGEAWQGKDFNLVFCTSVCMPIHSDTPRHDFIRLCSLADVPVISIHEVRHSHVSQLRRHGEQVEVVSKHVRHANISITQNI